MNYLAHALLSQPHAQSLLGNLAGDHIKGRLDSLGLPAPVAAGLRRHRAVDARSDALAAYRELRGLFPDGQRRFSGVMLDVLFDYLLSRNWDRYCRTPAVEFRAEVYRAIRNHGQVLPGDTSRLLARWAELDWLSAYGSFDGTLAVLERLAARMRGRLPLPAMLAVVNRHQTTLESAFLCLFDDLVAEFGSGGRADLRVPFQ